LRGSGHTFFCWFNFTGYGLLLNSPFIKVLLSDRKQREKQKTGKHQIF